MGECKYKLHIDGHFEEFEDEASLNTFLRENRRSLVRSLLTDKQFFSKQLDRQESAVAGLRRMSESVDFVEEGHTLTVNSGRYQGTELTPVTKFIYESKGEDGYRLVKGFNMQEWESIERARLAKEKSTDGQAKYEPQHIDDLISQMKHRWETQSFVGTSFHKVAQGFFDGDITTADDVYGVVPELKGNVYAAKQYIDQLQSLKDYLINKHGKDSVFLTEVKMFDPETKVGGISDLIAIDKAGQVHVYDYKTSSTPDSDWVQAKRLSVDYQLGFYRQILRRGDYDVSSINYIPVELQDIDLDSRVVNNFKMNLPKGVYVVETTPIGRNIHSLMPYDFSAKLQQVSTNADVAHFLKEAFNYDITKSDKTAPQTVDEVMSRLQKTSKGDQYQLLDEMNNNRWYYIDATRGEAFVRTAVENYLKAVDRYTKVMPVKFYDFVARGKALVERDDVVDYNDWSKTKNVDTANKVERLLSKYINDRNWSPLQSDALNDLGVVAFENRATNEVDYIAISANNLDRAPTLLRGKTLLGNFVPDGKAKQISGVKYDVLNKDLEFFKVYGFIKANEDVFKSKKIGSIFAVNMYDNNVIPRIRTQTVEQLERDWNTLMKHVPSNIKVKDYTWTPETVNFSESLSSYVGQLLADPKFTAARIKDLKSEYGNLQKAVDQDEKLTVLGKIQEVLDQSIGYRIDSAVESRKDLALAKLLVARAITQITNTPTQIEPDLKQWSFLIDENANMQNPNRIGHLAFQKMVNLITDGINNTSHAFNKYKRETALPMHSKLYESKANVLKVKVVGYNLDVFSNLFELDEQGARTMRLRDPKNDPKLTNAEREYITKYMEAVASIRVPKIVADVTKNSREANDGDYKVYMASPEARNIPLMRASLLTSFVGKEYKEFFSEYARRVLNPQNIYREDADSRRALENQSKIANFFDIFDIHEDKREEKLSTSKPEDFESDLEAVLDIYTLANIKQRELNKKMPVVNALKTLVALNEHYFFNDSSHTVEAMKNYISTVAMGNILVAGESPKLAVASKILQDTTSVGMIAMSPASFITQGLNSMFLSVIRTAANRFSEGAYGFKEFSQAVQTVLGSTSGKKITYGNYILTDALNDAYRLNERGMKEIAYKNQTTTNGLTNFRSEGMYWMNKIPGYMNRMVMFIAQSIKDGTVIVDALGNPTKESATQIVNGKLVYDEKKDLRFKTYLSDPNKPEHLQTKEWKEARALYLGTKADLAHEPEGLKADGSLARAYTNKERDSMKEFADEVDGNYDPETKSQWAKTAFGKIFLQFKGGWLTAKKNRWYTATSSDTSKGRWTTEWVDGEPKRVWEGKVSEGIVQSLVAIASEIKNQKTPLIWNSLDPVRKENMMLMFGDLLIFGLIGVLVHELGWLGDSKSDPVAYQFGRSLTNASNDLFIGNTIGTISGDKNPVAMFAWGGSVIDNTWGLITIKKNAGEHLLNTVGAYRSIHNLVKDGTN